MARSLSYRHVGWGVCCCTVSLQPFLGDLRSSVPRLAGQSVIECVIKMKCWCVLMSLRRRSAAWVLHWWFHLALEYIILQTEPAIFWIQQAGWPLQSSSLHILQSVNFVSRVQINALNFEGDESWRGNVVVYFVLEDCLCARIDQEGFLQICFAVRTDAKRP